MTPRKAVAHYLREKKWINTGSYLEGDILVNDTWESGLTTVWLHEARLVLSTPKLDNGHKMFAEDVYNFDYADPQVFELIDKYSVIDDS